VRLPDRARVRPSVPEGGSPRCSPADVGRWAGTEVASIRAAVKRLLGLNSWTCSTRSSASCLRFPLTPLAVAGVGRDGRALDDSRPDHRGAFLSAPAPR